MKNGKLFAWVVMTPRIGLVKRKIHIREFVYKNAFIFRKMLFLN